MNTPASGSWEVIIAGAGAMGSAAFYQLATRGVRVLAIDRFHPPHEFGSSHGDTRITRLALGEGADYFQFARRSHEIWRELEEATRRTLFQQVGALVHGSRDGRTAAHGAADFLQTTLEVARHHNLPHEILDEPALRRRFPQWRWRESDIACLEHTGGFIHPERCIAAQIELALHQPGATFLPGETVQSWQRDGDGLAVVTDRSTYRTDKLVLTTGAWIQDLAPELSPSTKIFRQVLHWFIPEGPPEDFSRERMPVHIQVPDATQAMFYGFPAIDGPGGGIKMASEQFELTTTPDNIPRAVSPDEIRDMHAIAAPRLRISDRCVRSVVCHYTVTPDFGFIIDRHPDCHRVMVVSACSGHGFKHSAAIGEAIAERLTGQNSAYDLSPFQLNRGGPARLA